MSDFVMLVDPKAKIVRSHIGTILADPRWEDLTGLGDGSESRSRLWEVEVTLKTKRGGEIPVWASVTPFADDLGMLQGYLLVGRDLRERKRLEEEHGRAIRLEAVRQLAGGVAHDFNSILAAVADAPHARSRLPGSGGSQACVGILGLDAAWVGREIVDRLDPYVHSEHSIDTDLELTAAAGIVAQHGGSLRFRPTGSGGVELQLLLPLCDG